MEGDALQFLFPKVKQHRIFFFLRNRKVSNDKEYRLQIHLLPHHYYSGEAVTGFHGSGTEVIISFLNLLD